MSVGNIINDDENRKEGGQSVAKEGRRKREGRKRGGEGMWREGG